MTKIKNIIASNNSFDLVARVEKIIISTGSNGSNYMILHLADSTGRIEARKWTITEEDKQNIQLNSFLYLKNVMAIEYRNVLQLKISEYQVLQKEELGKYGYDLNDFFVSAPVNIEKEYANLLELLNSMKNETYKKITIGLLNKYENVFLTFPAAMNIHHNVAGGLFWHSYTLVKNILAIKPNYKYANIDWELLISGAILHDIGKVIEIIDETGVDYSLEGKLLGHISIGNTEINKIAEELEILYDIDQNNKINRDVTLLQHMVLSSHGKHEFGSPTEPLVLEAIILSTFDNLDAKIYKVNEEISKVDVDNWSQRIISEDGKFFLNHFKK